MNDSQKLKTLTDAELHQRLKEAEDLSAGDMSAAIAQVELLKETSKFFPWAALTLAKFYYKSGKTEDARRLNSSIFNTHPSFIPALSQSIDLWKGSNEIGNILELVYSRIQNLEAISEKWFVDKFLEVVLYVAPKNIDELNKIIVLGVSSGFIDEKLAAALPKLVRYTSRLRSRMENLDASDIKYWTLVFLGRDEEICKREGNIAFINMSLFEISNLEGWERKISKSLIAVLYHSMRAATYTKDNGARSLAWVTEADRYTVIFWQFLTSQIHGAIPTQGLHKPAPISPGSLWVRSGNVELWALWNFLTDPVGSCELAEQVTSQLANADSEEGAALPGNDWWPRTDPAVNIKRLCLNAGWYARPGKATAAFNDWARRYLDALCYSGIFVQYVDLHLRVAALAPGLRREMWHASDSRIVPVLSSANVVAVTAFGHEIQAHHDSGNLERLWTDLGIHKPIQSLTAIEAPMSIWPNYPDEDWSVTFEKLARQTAEAIQVSKASVLVGSCGAYGLPLLHEMHKRFGITCIYIGHRMNVYLGVVTDALKNDPFVLRNPHSEHWIRPDLTKKYPSILQIDNGRYAPPRSGNA